MNFLYMIKIFYKLLMNNICFGKKNAPDHDEVIWQYKN